METKRVTEVYVYAEMVDTNTIFKLIDIDNNDCIYASGLLKNLSIEETIFLGISKLTDVSFKDQVDFKDLIVYTDNNKVVEYIRNGENPSPLKDIVSIAYHAIKAREGLMYVEHYSRSVFRV